MDNWIAFVGFSGACTVVAFIAGAGFAYGKFTQRIETLEDNVEAATNIAKEAKSTADAAHSLVKETMGRIGTLHDDIKEDFKQINTNIENLRREVLEFYKKK